MREVFKIEYHWYEGDYGKAYMLSPKGLDNLEDKLLEIKDVIIDKMNELESKYADFLEGEIDDEYRYFSNSLPTFFNLFIERLEKNGFEQVKVDDSCSYLCEDDYRDVGVKCYKLKKRVEKVDYVDING